MRDKESILKEIFENDPFGLLIVKPKKSAARTSDERLAASFDNINDFIEKNDREPTDQLISLNISCIHPQRVKRNEEKIKVLAPQDKFGLLETEQRASSRYF